MNRITSLLVFAFTTANMLSCSKNKSTTESFEPILKVKSTSSNSDSVLYFYDTNGRIEKEIHSYINAVANYFYLPGEVKKTFTESNGNTYTYTNFLNSDGLQIKTVSTINTNIVEYSYNADKTISSQKLTFPTYSLRFDYFYSNGNLDSIRHFDETGHLTNTTHYTYYLDQPQKLDWSAFGADFFGKDTRNMYKSLKRGNSYQQDYEYTYDSKGRVAIQKYTTTNGGITNSSTQKFTYW